jgi:membrane protease YdiL (CAAX protease family)
MLAGIAMFHYGFRRTPAPPTPRSPGVFISGAAVFLISLPLVSLSAAIWETLLRLAGLPVERQDLIEMFANVESPFLLVTMIVLAIGTAPVSEELVFRAGFYRYFRGRLPEIVALLAPALLFASLHVNWDTLEGLASIGPLVMLAVVFSLAYARTGRIGTSMVAHALFNLNTILMIFSGADI